MVANDGGCCRVIMRDGVLVPGMTMPVVGPPPPDPHPNVAVQRLREAWNMNIISGRKYDQIRRALPYPEFDPKEIRPEEDFHVAVQ